MKRWMIPTMLIERCNKCHPFYDDTWVTDDNTIRLWNKNDNKWYFWENPKPMIDNFGFIAERSFVPEYFSKVVKEYKL